MKKQAKLKSVINEGRKNLSACSFSYIFTK